MSYHEDMIEEENRKYEQACDEANARYRSAMERIHGKPSLWSRYGPVIVAVVILLVGILLLLVLPLIARAQTVTVDFGKMGIKSINRTLWLTDKAVSEVRADFGRGKVHRLRRKTLATPLGMIDTGEADIPPTYVDGRGAWRTVRPCVCNGVLDDGSKFAMNLPAEPVTFARMERFGPLQWHAVMVAEAIQCPTTITRPNGDVWESLVDLPACETHWTGRGTRLADAVRASGKLTKVK